MERAIIRIPYDALDDNPFQDIHRPEGLDWDHVIELAHSLLQHIALRPDTCGMEEIPTVRPVPGGRYQIEKGHHRRAACALCFYGALEMRRRTGAATFGALSPADFPGDERFKMFPAMIVGSSDEAMFWAGPMSGAAKSTSPLGWAHIIKSAKELGYEQQDIAGRLNKSQGWVSMHLSLLELPEEVQRYVATGQLGLRHALAALPMARHLPHILLQYINRGGVGLWVEEEKAVEDGELVNVRKVLPVYAIEAHVRRIVAGATRDLTGSQHQRPWGMEWIPEKDDWLDDKDLDRAGGGHHELTCEMCPRTGTFGRGELRCLELACHGARRTLWKSARERQRRHEYDMQVPVKRAELFTAPAPDGANRRTVEAKGRHAGARLVLTTWPDGRAMVEALRADFEAKDVEDFARWNIFGELPTVPRVRGIDAFTWMCDVVKPDKEYTTPGLPASRTVVQQNGRQLHVQDPNFPLVLDSDIKWPPEEILLTWEAEDEHLDRAIQEKTWREMAEGLAGYHADMGDLPEEYQIVGVELVVRVRERVVEDA